MKLERTKTAIPRQLGRQRPDIGGDVGFWAENGDLVRGLKLGLFGFVWVCFGFVFPATAKCLFFITLY